LRSSEPEPQVGVVDGGGGAGLRITDADDLRHDAADLGGSVELALALATLGGEVPHQVFVGVAQDVVALGAVLGEVESRVLENGDKVGEPLHLLLATAELGVLVEVREIGELVGVGQRGDDLLVDLVADVGLALEGDHVFEARAGRDSDRRVGLAGVFVTDVLDEEQDEDIILVLAGIHAAAEFIATGPERTVEFRFLNRHVSVVTSLAHTNYCAEEYPILLEKTPQVGREWPWKWNHSSPSLAFNPAGIGTERTPFRTCFSTVRSRQPGRPPARPSYVPLSIPLFVHRSYIPLGLFRDRCP
jgi:hypothetical protein